MQIKKRGALTSVIIVLVLLFIMAPIGWKAMSAFMKSSLSREISSDDLEIRTAYFNLAREIRGVIDDNNPVTIGENRIPVKLSFLKNNDIYEIKTAYAILAFDANSNHISAVVQKRSGGSAVFQELVQIQKPKNCTSSCICLARTKDDRYWIKPKATENDYDKVYDLNGAICENFQQNVRFYSLYESFKTTDWNRGNYAPYLKSSNLGYQYTISARPGSRFPNIPFVEINNLLETPSYREDITFLSLKSYGAEPVEVDRIRTVNIDRSYGYPFFSDQFVLTVNHDLKMKEDANTVSSFYVDKINLSKFRTSKDDKTIAVFITPNGVLSSNDEQESYIESRKLLLSQFVKKDQNDYARLIMTSKTNTNKIYYFMQYLRYSFNPMLFKTEDSVNNLKFIGSQSLKIVNQAITERLASCTGINKAECRQTYSDCDGSPDRRECSILLTFDKDYLSEQCRIYSKEYISIFKMSIGEEKFSEIFGAESACIDLFRPENMNKFLAEVALKIDPSEKFQKLIEITSLHEKNGDYLSAYKEFVKFYNENKKQIVMDDQTISAEISTGGLSKVFDLFSILADSKDPIYSMIELDDGTKVYALATIYNAYILVAKQNPMDSYLYLNAEEFDLDLLNSEDDLDIFNDRIELNRLGSYSEDNPEKLYSSVGVLMLLREKSCLNFAISRWPIQLGEDFAKECEMT